MPPPDYAALSTDPDLVRINTVWPRLGENVNAAIRALIEQAAD